MGDREIWPPATQKPLNRRSPKFVYVTTSAISTIMQKILSKSVQRFRFCACVISRPSAKSDSATFFWGGGSWERLQPRRAHRFWHKIRQTTWFRARKSLLGGAKPKSKVLTPIFPKNRHFWAPFRRDLEFFRPKTALTLDGSRVNDP